MKKIALLAAGILALISFRGYAQTQTSSVTITSGSLAIPDGYLVMLLGDTTSTFGNPTATSYTGNDPNEQVLSYTSMQDDTTGLTGVMRYTFTITLGTGPGEIPAGDYLMLRWFPSISLATYNASSGVGSASAGPGNGTAYGYYTASTKEYPSDPNPQTTTPWTAPQANDYGYDDWFVTTSETSTVMYSAQNVPPNSDGLASYTVVPEPATLSFLAGAFAIGALAFRRRK